MSHLVIKHNIEQIKVGKNSIALGGLYTLSVIHFPSLKPIYDGFSGTGIHNVFDISNEGLTIAHNSQIKGQILIHNFTNIEIDKRKKATSFSKNKKSILNTDSKLKKTPKQILEIDAHK